MSDYEISQQQAMSSLTLRDYFAAQAIPAYAPVANGDHEWIARVAYTLADAMLAERSKW